MKKQAEQRDPEGVQRKSVVIIGLNPSRLDFTSPEFAAFPGLRADQVMAGITAVEEGFRVLGYDVQHCHLDVSQTAEAVVTAALENHRLDCILIGAGVRAVPSHLLLFEKLMNVIHEHAPQAKIGFNTNPSDTLDTLCGAGCDPCLTSSKGISSWHQDSTVDAGIALLMH